MRIKIIEMTGGSPEGKKADAELEFTDGPLAGLRLIGFGVWTRRDGKVNVTFPARTYTVNGERRSFALLRPGPDANAYDGQERLRDLIIAAWEDHGKPSAERENETITAPVTEWHTRGTVAAPVQEAACPPAPVRFDF